MLILLSWSFTNCTLLNYPMSSFKTIVLKISHSFSKIKILGNKIKANNFQVLISVNMVIKIMFVRNVNSMSLEFNLKYIFVTVFFHFQRKKIVENKIQKLKIVTKYLQIFPCLINLNRYDPANLWFHRNRYRWEQSIWKTVAFFWLFCFSNEKKK